MAKDIFQKDPLYVEWTTVLPSVNSPSKSTTISVGGLDGNIYLLYAHDKYILYINIKDANQTSLIKYCPVTTFLHHPDTRKPILVDVSLRFDNKTLLWTKCRAEIFEKFPNVTNSYKFTITCLFHNTEHYVQTTHFSTKTTMTTGPVDFQSLSRKFSAFLKNESLSDVKLKCGDRIFYAHKLVLAASSEVFAEMFRKKMEETEAGVVDIKDVDPDVLELLLQYMYLSQRPDLCEFTAGLLYEAADKYAVHDLRWACSNWMMEYQTKSNCLDLLVLADKHSDKNFKETMIRFVAENLSDLSDESLSTFQEKYPLLALSVLKKWRDESLPIADDSQE